MRQIDTYISEKLILNKNSKPEKVKRKKVSFNMLYKALKNTGEVDLSLIFGESTLPEDNEGREIKSLWVDDKEIYYSYYSKIAGYDCEKVFYINLLSDDELLHIYDYLLEF